MAELNARTDAILRRLVRKEALSSIRKVLSKTRPMDLAAAMEHLTWNEQRQIYRSIDDPDYAADVLARLTDESAREITRSMSEDQVVDLLGRMEADDATDVVEVLSDDLRDRVLAELGEEDDATEVRELLSWPSDSAGGIMSPSVFKMAQTASCGDAITALRQLSEELESIFYLYVVDAQNRLVGVTSLRTLIVHPEPTPLSHVITRDVITVGPRQDQEEVARFVARYDLMAVPVVDEHRRLLGIVTVDDVVDVIREEAAEDMMRMAGMNEEADGLTRGVFSQFRMRAGWLLATIAGGILAAEIIGTYEDTLKAVAVLAGFIPVIMGMGGNVGIQSATIAVRGLATGRVQLGGAMSFIYRESRVGILLGILYGFLLGGYGLLRYWDQPLLGVSVAASITLAIALASVLGAAIPIFFDRFGVDPAIATGPFVTTAVDILGILIYFNVARAMMGL